MHARTRAFSLIELLVAVGIVATLATVLGAAGWKAYERSSLAISASNIRQLCVGAAAYLGDNNNVFWPYRSDGPEPGGVTWWFGYEPPGSMALGEGNRILRPEDGPLGGYVPASFRPDPSLKLSGKAFKPKYKFGYLGVGYNVLLGGKWTGTATRVNALTLEKAGRDRRLHHVRTSQYLPIPGLGVKSDAGGVLRYRPARGDGAWAQCRVCDGGLCQWLGGIFAH